MILNRRWIAQNLEPLVRLRDDGQDTGESYVAVSSAQEAIRTSFSSVTNSSATPAPVLPVVQPSYQRIEAQAVLEKANASSLTNVQRRQRHMRPRQADPLIPF